MNNICNKNVETTQNETHINISIPKECVMELFATYYSGQLELDNRDKDKFIADFTVQLENLLNDNNEIVNFLDQFVCDAEYIKEVI